MSIEQRRIDIHQRGMELQAIGIDVMNGDFTEHRGVYVRGLYSNIVAAHRLHFALLFAEATSANARDNQRHIQAVVLHNAEVRKFQLLEESVLLAQMRAIAESNVGAVEATATMDCVLHQLCEAPAGGLDCDGGTSLPNAMPPSMTRRHALKHHDAGEQKHAKQAAQKRAKRATASEATKAAERKENAASHRAARAVIDDATKAARKHENAAQHRRARATTPDEAKAARRRENAAQHRNARATALAERRLQRMLEEDNHVVVLNRAFEMARHLLRADNTDIPFEVQPAGVETALRVAAEFQTCMDDLLPTDVCAVCANCVAPRHMAPQLLPNNFPLDMFVVDGPKTLEAPRAALTRSYIH